MAERERDRDKDSLAAFWGGVSQGLDSLRHHIKQSSVKSLRESAVRLAGSIERIVFMVRIPEQFLINEQVTVQFYRNHLVAALKTGTLGSTGTLTDDEREAYEAALKELYEKTASDAEQKKLFEEWLSRAMRGKPHVIEQLQLDKPYKSLLYSGLIWAWISFEVFTSDLWEAVVNMSAGKVRSRILRSVGAARPTIKVDYIEKYNLDLRGRLGTVMRDGCDFTSLGGIQKAYAVVFPKSQSISDALGKIELVQLEASRHLIVHRSGIVDDEFLRKTNLKLKKGHELPVTDKQVLDYCNLTVEVALALLVAAESLVGRKSPKKQTK